MAVQKVPEKPKTKALEVKAETLEWIGKIRTFDGDIKSFASKVKSLEEMATEMVEAMPEFEEVERLLGELKVARENLKRALMAKSGYNDLVEEIGEEKLALKDAKANMSDFLLGYFKETGEKQVDLGAKARQVNLKASLGKEIDFQTNIFSQRGDDED